MAMLHPFYNHSHQKRVFVSNNTNSHNFKVSKEIHLLKIYLRKDLEPISPVWVPDGEYNTNETQCTYALLDAFHIESV